MRWPFFVSTGGETGIKKPAISAGLLRPKKTYARFSVFYRFIKYVYKSLSYS
jgi:hypothetical protein